MFQPSEDWAKKINEEWRILEEQLPGMPIYYEQVVFIFIFTA